MLFRSNDTATTEIYTVPYTLSLHDALPIADGHLDFTIDQQPYLQGFVPIFQLFMAKYTSGLVAPSETNTGLLFVTRTNVRPYLTTTTRYEGSSAFSEYPVT